MTADNRAFLKALGLGLILSALIFLVVTVGVRALAATFIIAALVLLGLLMAFCLILMFGDMLRELLRTLFLVALVAIAPCPAHAEEDAYFTMAFPDLVTAPANAHIHTHLRVAGDVASVRKEKDGDYHVKLCQGTYCLILEIIPEVPMVRPHKGQRIQACGIVRFDGWHQIWEIHPLLTWKPL